MPSPTQSPPVVLGVDAQDQGPLPAAWAAEEAARRGLPLRLVHVLPPPIHDTRAFDQARHRKELRERGEAALDRATAAVRAARPDLAPVTAVLEDSPARALCGESRRAALIVLGSRGLGRLEEVLSTYSVAVPVSAQARCPVVVVRADGQDAGEPDRVVVGVDGSPASAAAVEFAFGLAAGRGVGLRAVWSWQPPVLFLSDERNAVRTARERLLEATAEAGAAHPEVTVTHEVVVGHPVEQLAEAAAGALAVVVGRRGRGGFTGMHLGSVPHGLLHRSPCPVVTVPEAPADPDHGRHA